MINEKQIKVPQYDITCPNCGDKLTDLNKKLLQWNYEIHLKSCKDKSKRNSTIKLEDEKNGNAE